MNTGTPRMNRVIRRKASTLVFILVAASVILASSKRPSPYHPPLLDIIAPVASFGEYRPDHLHPGVDLSTGGRTGLPVVAVADGEIYRLKVEWRGYGRALYLRHADGQISVYAHLESFEERTLALESRVEEAKRARGLRYPGDIYLSPAIPVHRGQRIALSGESGAGLPHLHFELRGSEERPSDPSPVLGRIRSGSSPRFESLVFLARGTQSLMGGSRSTELPLARQPGGVYGLSFCPLVTGPFVPEARIVVEDRSGHRMGIRGMKVHLDGTLVYEFVLDGFRFEQYPQVGLLLDHARSRMSPPSFTYRLLRLPGNELGRVPSVQEEPFPDLSAGLHHLDLEATGAFGEIARARIPIRMVFPPTMHLEESSEGDKEGFVRLSLHRDGGHADGPSSLRAIYTALGKKLPVVCQERSEFPEAETCSFKLSQSGWGLTASLYFENTPISRVTRVFPRPMEVPPEPAPIRVLPGPEYVELEVSLDNPSTVPPARLIFHGSQGDLSQDLREQETGLLVASLPLAVWREVSSLEMEWEALPKPVRAPVPLTPHVGSPTAGMSMRDCGVRLDLPSGALFAPTALACESLGKSPPPREEGLVLGSSIVRLLPEGLPLARKALLTFPLPVDCRHPERVGIYRLDPSRGAWDFLGGEKSGSEISIPLGRFDTYALLEDSAPPRILDLVPAPGGPAVDSQLSFSVRVEDEGSGLNYDGVHLRLDAQEIEMEFDPDRGRSTGRPSTPLSSGTHAVSIWAVDRAGNRTAERAFEVSIR